LPLFDDVLDIAIAVLFLTIALWVVAGASVRRGATALIHGLDEGGAFHRSDFVLLPQSRVARAIWLRQGMVLGALLCLAFGASRSLARYHLVVDGHSKVVAGASYVDVNFWIPAYDLLVVCWLATALILMLAGFMPRFLAWLFVRRAHWLAPLAVLAILFFGAFAVPAGIEAVYVDPNQITLELPYLIRSIAGTRQAYNLAGPSIEEREFDVSAEPLAAADLEQEASTLQDARIWDWRALEPQLQQIQGLRP
jgi:uncharacterized protein